MNKKKRMKIIYEDKFIIVINKECGLLTVATDKERDRTLYHEVREYLGKKNQKVFIVHRLDKDTSGVIIFAKSEKIKGILQNNWDKLVKNREYVAIVCGKVEKKEDTIKSFLKENKELYTYSTSKGDEGSKLAITKYKRVMYGKKYTLLKINILTGRKNQIRVHMNDMGNPILGDKKYGNCKHNRLMLHAIKLEIIHPVTKEKMIFETVIPKEFCLLIAKMREDKLC